MVPDAPGEGGEEVSLVVMDSTSYPSPPRKHDFTVKKAITLTELYTKIKEELEYNSDSIELRLNKTALDESDNRELESLFVLSGKNVLFISRKAGTKDTDFKHKRITESMSLSSNGKTAAPSSTSYTPPSSSSSSHSSALVPYGPLPQSSYTSYSSSSYSSGWGYGTSASKSSTGFVGLSNQGATCYMNSLIQTLYMTPEFRYAVYRWSFDDKYKQDLEKEAQNETPNGAEKSKEKKDEDRLKKEKSSIPLQLQRLFGRLQLCDVQAVKTKDLTKSFGWEDTDAFTQHDVQELCRVLFDALEKNFQGTEQADLVNDLYQGKMKDYVQCKECHNESARVDNFLDIPLVIRGFGETTAVQSVEEGLRKFVQPEVLDGDNQYLCNKCGKKVDAIKGLKFITFPYLLTLQLKRFDFDFQTMRRIKLNDRVTFPLTLDLNSFIFGEPELPKHNKHTTNGNTNNNNNGDYDNGGMNGIEDDHEFGETEYGHTDGSREKLKHRNDDEDEELDGVDAAPPPTASADRPYVYELYSVLIHRGSSMGGHYYAYIKSFEKNKWYEFNDSIVSEISVDDIKKAFGGDEEQTSSYSYKPMYSFRSTSNAYMLMYRQVDKSRNRVTVSEKEIPDSVCDIIDEEANASKKKKEQEEKEREMTKLKVYYNGQDKIIPLHKSTTITTATKVAASQFGIADKFPEDCIRLRHYQHYNDLPGDTFTGKEHRTLDDLDLFHIYYNTKCLLLETKEQEEEFDEYNPKNMLFRVSKFDGSSFKPPVNIWVHKHGNIADLKEVIEQRLHVPKEHQKLIKETVHHYMNNDNQISVINEDHDTLLRHVFSEPQKLYLENLANVQEQSDDTMSPALLEIERTKNIIEVKFNLPGKEEADQKITVDKNMTLKEFREKIAPIVGLPVEDFKIKRSSPPQLHELVNESESLADTSITDGMALVIERGRPQKEGESIYPFELLDLSKDTNTFTELFELIVHEDTLVSDLKKAVAKRMVEEKKVQGEIDPTCIRLRELSVSLSSRRVGKALVDTYSMKKSIQYFSRRLAVQLLPEPETVKSDKDLVIFVQLFKPSTFELTRKEDFVVNEEIPFPEFKASLGKKFGIEEQNVQVARVDTFYNFHDDPDILEIPTRLNFNPRMHGTKISVEDVLYLRNGSLVIVKDSSEKLKELTKEEKEAIEKETRKKMSQNHSTSHYFSYKEKALKIHTTD